MPMDRPGEVRTFEVTERGRFLGLSHFVDIPGKPLQLLFNFFNDDVGTGGKPLTELLRTFDTYADQWVPTPPDVYRYVRITGGRSGYKQGGDELGLRQFEGGQLVIPRAQRVFQIGPPLPKQLWFSPEDGPSLFLNNSYMTVVSNLVLVRTSKQISYLVLEKHSGEWRRLTIPGNASWNVRAFRSWIAGMVEESLYGEQFLISPGRHKPIPRNQFDTVDGYLQNEAIYRPGKLFLYDVPGRRYYQWDTHDADSEVILVEDGQVYYRVDQAIYRAKIGEKELDKPELLVEDKEVPGIHWAFFGPTTPVAAAPAAGRK